MTTATKREAANGVAGAAEKLQAPAAPSLWQRINAITAGCRGLRADGKHPQFGFDFISIGAIENRLAELLPQHGLVIVPEVMESTVDGKSAWVRMRFTVLCDDGSGELASTWEDAGKDRTTAISFATKFFYKRLFHIEDGHGEDPDAATTDAGSRQAASPARPRPAAASKPAGEKLTVVERAPVGRSCPRHECEGVLEAVTWSNGQTKICCDHWRKEQGGCRHREDVPVEDADAGDIVPVDSTAEIPFG